MDTLFNIILTNISNHISDIADSTFSVIINGLIIILITLFFLAIKYQSARTFLIKIKSLSPDENPKYYAWTLLIIFIIIKIIQIFIFQLFVVDGQSMEPTLHTADFLVVDRWTSINPNNIYTRGSVIVFKYREPSGFNDNVGGKFLVKRVVAIPGDRIIMNSSNNIKIITADGRTIMPTENHILYKNKPYPNIDKLLTRDEYFVMGDNRDNSYDSRYFSAITRDEISGIALFRILPNTSIYPGRVSNIYN